MEALVYAFSELRIREDGVSWVQGLPSHPDTPPNIYEGGLGVQQQCLSAQGSKPKNFRLRHLRGLALYLPGHIQPAGQCESHWLGQLMTRGCLSRPEGMAWPLDLPQGTLSPGNSRHSALREAQLPRGSLGNTASSSSMDPAKGTPSQPGPPKAWDSGLRGPAGPQRSPPVLCAREPALGLWRGHRDLSVQAGSHSSGQKGNDDPGGGSRSREEGLSPTSSPSTPTPAAAQCQSLG